MKYYTLAYYNDSAYGIEGWNEGEEIYETKEAAKAAVIKYYRDLLTKYYAAPMTKHQIYKFESRVHILEAERLYEEYAYNNEPAKYKRAAQYINGVTKIRIHEHNTEPFVVAHLDLLYKINIESAFKDYYTYINALVENIKRNIEEIDNTILDTPFPTKIIEGNIIGGDTIREKLNTITFETKCIVDIISKL